MKKEKVLTIREEIDVDKLIEEIDNVFCKFKVNNLEILGILDIIKFVILEDMNSDYDDEKDQDNEEEDL